jgi:hypothetical protein
VTSNEEKVSHLKKLYQEIVMGFSESEHSGRPIFIKHFSELENAVFNSERQKYQDAALQKGLEPREDKLIFLTRQGLWSREKDDEILRLEKEISNLDLILKTLFLKRQISETKDKISKCREKLLEIQLEKQEIVGLCVEDFVEKKINETIILNSFYKDSALKDRLFSDDEFDTLSEIELSDLIRKLSAFYKRFQYEEIKKICACSFLIHLFGLSDGSAFYFYGRHVVNLSILQVNMFSQAKYFKSLMEMQKSSPPEDVVEDPDKMIEWYDTLGKPGIEGRDSEASGVGYSKASRSELEALAGGRGVTLAELAGKKGGLTKQDFINMS